MSLDSFLDWILEKELSELSPEDVRSFDAYHGKINRQTAEVLLNRNGQFLVRDSRSNQFVLSCNSMGEHLHFMIHEKIIQVQTKVHDDNNNINKDDDDGKNVMNSQKLYCFENDAFPSIGGLLKHYVDNSLPITVTSQIVITTPLKRQTPIESQKYVTYYKKNLHKSWEELTEDFHKIQYQLQNDDQESTSSSQKSNKTTSPKDNSAESNAIYATPHKTDASSSSANNNTTIYSTYLEHLSQNISAISMEASQRSWSASKKTEIYQLTDMHLPALLCETDSGTLAEHFFRCDLFFFGVNSETIGNNCADKLNSCIEFALLPAGKQFRRDVIVRNECMKYFVIATLLKQTNCFETQIELLSKWIRIASKLGLDFGDQFGFGSIMYGLLDTKIGRQKTLWHGLKAKDVLEYQLFESCLVPKFLALLDSSLEICSPNVTIPFLISILHMIECNAISNAEFLPKVRSLSIDKIVEKKLENERGTGLGNFTLDTILAGIVASTKMIDSVDGFQNNCFKLLFNNLFVPQCDNVLALFMTEFHLQFFFGSQVEVGKVNYRIFQTLELRL